MKLHFEKRVLLGLSITLAILVILGVFSFSSTQRLIKTARLLAHTSRVIDNTDRILKLTLDTETGQRGYIITGDKDFLEPFNTATGIMATHLNSLDSLTANNPSQHRRVMELQELVDKHFAWTQKTISVRDEGFEKSQALVAGGGGKKITDSIRALVKQMQDEERETFRKGNTISTSILQQFQYSFVGLAIAVTLLLTYLFYNVNENLKARNDAEKELKTALYQTSDLFNNAPCGYLSVNSNIVVVTINQTLLDWLGYTKQEVVGKMKYEDLLAPVSKADFLKSFEKDFEKFKEKGHVIEIEFDFQRKDGSILPVIVNSVAVFDINGEFVKSRSSVADNTERKKADLKIRQLNTELESFTYSVSHDLRSPLRSITGFAQILKEDHGDKLDAEAHGVIQTIMNNARRMGQLVDDLLDFSRMGRKGIVPSNLNMDEVVQTVLHELTSNQNGRKLNVHVLPLDQSVADLSMMRQVWTNLISNALKYSSKQETTEIEIGSTHTKESVCYYVKDNGTGFDMKYVDKLFGVFQRLHKMKDYEGTGVGLALVKRIVQRHGGEVWGEGKVDHGATFYFTLPLN